MSCDPRVVIFEYPPVHERSGERAMSPAASEANSPGEQVVREIQAREMGRLEGESAARAKHEEQLQKERTKIAESFQQFQIERNRYFEAIESEVVQLALAMARRILHREANVDPELLAGLVRHTLEKLRAGTKVRIRVNPAGVAGMQKQFADKAEIVSDASVAEESCLLVTEVGTTAISVDEQLKEIERGLMDLLAQRPPVAP